MFILSVDTAFGQESCAIHKHGKVIAYAEGSGKTLQAENLFECINKVLAETNLKYENFDYLAADIGPGSFTGIRIGLSAILGVCLAQDKKFVGVSSLEALAYKIESKDTDYISVAIDAGKNEAYFVEYEQHGELVKALYEPELMPVERILTATIGNMKECKVQATPNAKDIGLAAYTMISNSAADFNRKSPIYIRKSEAEIKLNNV